MAVIGRYPHLHTLSLVTALGIKSPIIRVHTPRCPPNNPEVSDSHSEFPSSHLTVTLFHILKVIGILQGHHWIPLFGQRDVLSIAETVLVIGRNPNFSPYSSSIQQTEKCIGFNSNIMKTLCKNDLSVRVLENPGVKQDI
ncbi:hypothetical protein J6590_042788 [Homalodisca vitripennis]|nr:hypothetical protein J6590_042788 [Homalodisca vitripennis]